MRVSIDQTQREGRALQFSIAAAKTPVFSGFSMGLMLSAAELAA
jgi:hypothetical protein